MTLSIVDFANDSANDFGELSTETEISFGPEHEHRDAFLAVLYVAILYSAYEGFL